MKDKILNKAIELFNTKGFDKVSIDQICAECGVTKGAFYHHYSSKHAILLKYYEVLLKNSNELLEILVLKNSVLEQIWSLIEHIIDCILKIGPVLTNELLIAGLKEKELLLPINIEKENLKLDSQLKLMVKLIEKGLNTGEIISNSKAEYIFESYMLGLLGTVFHWCSSIENPFDLKLKLKRSFEFSFKN